LQGFELGDVVIALAAETGFLESEIVEIFAEGEEDLGFDHERARTAGSGSSAYCSASWRRPTA